MNIPKCNRLKILSFDESVFLNKAKIMYKVANNIAPSYLINLFQLRNSSDDTIYNLRSVGNTNFRCPSQNWIYLRKVCHIRGLYHLEQHSIGNSSSLDLSVNKCKAWMKRGRSIAFEV